MIRWKIVSEKIVGKERKKGRTLERKASKKIESENRIFIMYTLQKKIDGNTQMKKTENKFPERREDFTLQMNISSFPRQK